MKHRLVFALFVLSAAAVFATGKDLPAVRVGLEELAAIGGPESDALFLWTGISVDRDGNVYFSDALGCSLKKFGPDGALLKRAGRKGRGPGEFDKPVGLAVVGERVYAWDLYDRSVQVFDRDLDYRLTLPMPGSVDALAVLPGGEIAACVRASLVLTKVVVFRPDGTPVREFDLTDPKDEMAPGSISLAVDPSGAAYYGYLFRNLVEKRSLDGERIWSREILGAGPGVSGNVQGIPLPAETCILSLARDGRGRLFVLGGSAAGRPGRDVFVLGPEGAVLGSFVLPEPSHSVYFDHRDFLYVSADGGVTMKKYRVTFK